MNTLNVSIEPSEEDGFAKIVEGFCDGEEFTLADAKKVLGRDRFNKRGLEVTKFLQFLSKGVGRYNDKGEMLFISAKLLKRK